MSARNASISSRRRRQADQVEVDAPQQQCAIGRLGGDEPFLLVLRGEEGIDGIRRPGGVRDLRQVDLLRPSGRSSAAVDRSRISSLAGAGAPASIQVLSSFTSSDVRASPSPFGGIRSSPVDWMRRSNSSFVGLVRNDDGAVLAPFANQAGGVDPQSGFLLHRPVAGEALLLEERLDSRLVEVVRSVDGRAHARGRGRPA